ncbi:MAG: hypothetical protein J6X03_02145 [Bacilli bacterium]|nr:hypothetical protein [Bacilli bacterium]
MKYYSLSAVVNSEPVTINKKFKTREEAISYMFDFLNNKYIYNAEVEEEYAISNDNHNIEYVLSNNNRFAIARHTL